MTKEAIDSLVAGRYERFETSCSLGSRLVRDIYDQHSGPLLPTSDETGPHQVYLYCPPCLDMLDLLLGICRQSVNLECVIRVDDRLSSQSHETLVQGMSLLEEAVSGYERGWRALSKYKKIVTYYNVPWLQQRDHSCMSTYFDLPWLQQREYSQGEAVEGASKDTAPTTVLDEYFALHRDDKKCAAIAVFGDSGCSGKLLSQTVTARQAKQPKYGQNFRLERMGIGRDTKWDAKFFGKV